VRQGCDRSGLRGGGLAPNVPLVNPLRLLRKLRDERRRLGWSAFLRSRGWKFVLLFLVAYLVRDLVLYVLVPLAIVAGLKR
jgi:hypothetical protein